MENKWFYVEDHNLKLRIPKFNQVDLDDNISVQKGHFVAWSSYAVLIKTNSLEEPKKALQLSLV